MDEQIKSIYTYVLDLNAQIRDYKDQDGVYAVTLNVPKAYRALAALCWMTPSNAYRLHGKLDE